MKIAMISSYKCHTFCMMKLPLKHHSPVHELFSDAPTCLSAAFEHLQGPDGAVFATAAIPLRAPSVALLTSADAVQQEKPAPPATLPKPSPATRMTATIFEISGFHENKHQDYAPLGYDVM
jgi:hypothetical protein